MTWKCRFIKKFLPLDSDEAGSKLLEKKIQEHIASCPDCNAIYEQHKKNRILLRTVPFSPPSPEIMQDIWKGIQKRLAESPIQEKPPRSWKKPTISIAALAAIFLIFFWAPTLLQWDWGTAFVVYQGGKTVDDVPEGVFQGSIKNPSQNPFLPQNRMAKPSSKPLVEYQLDEAMPAGKGDISF